MRAKCSTCSWTVWLSGAALVELRGQAVGMPTSECRVVDGHRDPYDNRIPQRWL
jgi:hypothetical protein